MSRFNRRQYFVRAAAIAAGVATTGGRALAGPGAGCTLSIGTYSLKGMSIEEGIALVAKLGYDGIEIAAQAGSDGEPAKLSPARRAEVRRRLDAAGLKLTALMEHLTPAADARRHRADVERVERVFDLARELNPDRPPLVQTILGASGTWDKVKGLCRDRLGDWLAVAKERKVVLAIKPHRGGAMSRPADAIGLIRELGDSPWLRMVYDYSHYAFRDMPLEATVREALPYTAHVAVKDAVQQGERVVFALPGESGTFDYPALLRLFYDGGYRGDFCCEVSAMVSGRPGYDPTKAATTCYENMARAFTKANIPRA